MLLASNFIASIMNSDPTPTPIDTLIAHIERAFVKVRLEDGISMAQARAIDDWQSEEETRKARGLDGEKTWLDITDAKVEKYCDVLAFLDAKGYQFYLPAFMRWFLRHPRHDNYLVGDLIFRLTPMERKRAGFVMQTDRIEKYKPLSKEQRQAVCDFLELVATDDRFSHNEEAKFALENYWKKSK